MCFRRCSVVVYMSKLNTIFKYADDTTLLVPEHTDVSICDEFEHV